MWTNTNAGRGGCTSSGKKTFPANAAIFDRPVPLPLLRIPFRSKTARFIVYTVTMVCIQARPVQSPYGHSTVTVTITITIIIKSRTRRKCPVAYPARRSALVRARRVTATVDVRTNYTPESGPVRAVLDAARGHNDTCTAHAPSSKQNVYDTSTTRAVLISFFLLLICISDISVYTTYPDMSGELGQLS